jgi:hypothetical protein
MKWRGGSKCRLTSLACRGVHGERTRRAVVV